MEGGQLFIIVEQYNCEQFFPLPKHLMVLSENLNEERNYNAHKCIYTGLIFNSIDTLHLSCQHPPD